MVEGEFLTADDLGPLGRLVAPGELLVLEEWDVERVHAERTWISERYRRADGRAERLRVRLRTARMGEHRDAVREAFEDWTMEAVKLALCGRYLSVLAGNLGDGRQQAMNLPADFRWEAMPQVTEVWARLLAATDEEIAGGMRFRAG